MFILSLHLTLWFCCINSLLLKRFQVIVICLFSRLNAWNLPFQVWSSPITPLSSIQQLSHVRLLVTPWTAAHQAPPSMGFSRQEYWSGVLLPSPREVISSLNISHTYYAKCICKNESVQSLSHLWLFATPWTAARQASQSITNSPELAQTHVYQFSDAIQPSHPLSSPSPPAFNLS